MDAADRSTRMIDNDMSSMASGVTVIALSVSMRSLFTQRYRRVVDPGHTRF